MDTHDSLFHQIKQTYKDRHKLGAFCDLKKDMVPLFVQAFWDMELLLTYREKQNFVETN